MSNVLFGYPVHSDAGEIYSPSISGGSWLAALPISNVQDRRLSRVARSTDATTDSTKFEVDLGVSRTLKVIALLLPNISSSGTVRVRSSNSAGSFGSPIYDSTALTVYPSGYTAETIGDITPTFIRAIPAGTAARYWLFEISDTGNTDGYIDVSRLVLAGGWTPSKNARWGVRLGFESETERSVTDGGSATYNRKPVRRTFEFVVDNLTDTEAITDAFDLHRLAGTDRQMFFVLDPDDTTHLWKRSILCVMRSLSALEMAYVNRNNTAYQLVEEL
jgi:hypothetical protein